MIPECESTNKTTASEWIPFTIPLRYDKTPEQCLRFSPINVYETQENILAPSCTPESFNRSDIIKCNNVVFETEEITISNEWNITCEDNKWKLTLVGTINNIGQLICFPITGLVSDRY